MGEAKFISFDPDVHMEDFVKMYHEYATWFFEGFKENDNLDFISLRGVTVSDWVDNNLEPYISMKLPKGTLHVIEVDGELAGMGVLRKLSDDTGEVKRMLIRPKFRRRGFGRRMLNTLIDIGRSVGCSRFLLDSPNWAYPSHNLYRSCGFMDVEEYPESEIPSEYRQYWIFMEKND